MKEFFVNRRLKGEIEIKLKYKDQPTKIWKADKFHLCAHIMAVAEQFMKDGYTMTLRQLYYQLVGKDLIPNHITVYKKLGKIKDDLLYSGMMDWSAFEDRTRVPKMAYAVNGVDHALEDAAKYYRINRQRGQEIYLELLTEKDAISEIIRRVTTRYHIRLVINKGYTSSSAIYSTYRRLIPMINEGKKVVILYFGDHDPSGLDMVRDIQDRLMFLFTRGQLMDDSKVQEWWEKEDLSVWDLPEDYIPEKRIEDWNDKDNDRFFQGRNATFIEEKELFTVHHVGLTREQVELYNLPANPAKIQSDPRGMQYFSEHKTMDSWEVDALSPQVIERLVEDAILKYIDKGLFDQVVGEETEQRNILKELARKYSDNGNGKE